LEKYFEKEVGNKKTIFKYRRDISEDTYVFGTITLNSNKIKFSLYKRINECNFCLSSKEDDIFLDFLTPLIRLNERMNKFGKLY
jgi:hypothetical protein